MRNRLWKPVLTLYWFTAVLVLTLFSATALQAEPLKRPLPARINHVGLNRYIFTIADISPPPYNQPPYPPSGSFSDAQCEVTGLIP